MSDKNDQGEWLSTNYLNANQLGKLQAVVRVAFDYVVLREPEGKAAFQEVMTTTVGGKSGESKS